MSSNKIFYAIYGASGFGRGVMPLARKQLSHLATQDYELVFIDDSENCALINGHKVYNFDEFTKLPAQEKYVAIAIANSKIREKLVLKLDLAGIKAWSVYADTIIMMDEVRVGEGAVLCNHVHFTSNIQIGKYFHANYFSYVAHDCVIGDYVTFAPRVSCNGNIIIEDHAYIGTGAVIKQGTSDQPLIIGRGAVVGMGAVVTKSVPAGVTVVGNPARVLKKN
ncbi:NeuD/PglB/VioB family sugar acetyltransferase [Acinetobacter haemolyticus]|uniref:NeuD/PglB/VioB family sugar acetyltransferase n=1 Tax=Acinetobacter haemolyticus TaxID=29430 RepID=UPI001372558A|nr:NeuD/PglB/VioB family sugar acetyltransferase [Acinetobacter haemolyticus]NAR67540.1 acetyltransferase [Acinetobacter haemolyticus]